MANHGTFIGVANLVLSNLATVDTEELPQGNLLVSNLRNEQHDDVWRFSVAADKTTADARVVFSQPQTVGAASAQIPRGSYPGVSEVQPSLGPTDSIRVRLFNEANDLLWDSGAVGNILPGYGVWWTKPLAPTQGVKQAIFTFNAASRVAQGFADIGMIGLWEILQPDVNVAYPAGLGWRPVVESQKTPAGRVYTSRYEPLRQWALDFNLIGNDNALKFDDMIRRSGESRQVFICRDDLPLGQDAMHAMVQSNRLIQSITAERRSVSLTFNEFI